MMLIAASVLLGFSIGVMLGRGIDPRPFLQMALAVVGVYGLYTAVEWLNQRDGDIGDFTLGILGDVLLCPEEEVE